MLTLLRQAQVRDIMPDYVVTLLSAFREPISLSSTLHASRPGVLVESLTEREREVLHILLEGASNRDIAHRLVLSINTVKRHNYNICGKLGVQSRTQAIVKARASCVHLAPDPQHESPGTYNFGMQYLTLLTSYTKCRRNANVLLRCRT